MPSTSFVCSLLSLYAVFRSALSGFDCSDRQCCDFKDDSYEGDSAIDCTSLAITECFQYDFCEWDCTPSSTAQQNAALEAAGYTLKRFKGLSTGDGQYNEPVLADDGPPTSVHNEPETAEEMQTWSRMNVVDECGVEWEYQMDLSSASSVLSDIASQRQSDTANTQTNSIPNIDQLTANQERLIRRLTVFGNDGRIKINSQSFHRYTGYLQFSTFGGDEKRCSATLVSANWLVTAGHCVHSGKGNNINSEYFHNWRFYPGLVRDSQMNQLEITAVKVVAFSEWTDVYGPNWDYDIALIQLNTVDAGITPLAIGYDNNMQDQTYMHTVGYPGDKPWLTKWSQYCSWNYVLDEFCVSDNCDIAPGSSGSPVYKVGSKGYNEIVCIVSWENDYFNGCARITDSKYQHLCAFIGC